MTQSGETVCNHLKSIGKRKHLDQTNAVSENAIIS